MTDPIVPSNYFKERAGVLAVAAAINRQKLIWRETPNADVGIDGQIEHVSPEGVATGRILAVQVKSGESYLKYRGDYLVFYPHDKHKRYWQRFPIPVVLCLHNPLTGKVFWTDARQQLVAPDFHGAILIHKSNTLDTSTHDMLFAAYGPLPQAPLPANELATELAAIRSLSDPVITGLDMFLAGMTDIATKLFFDISLFIEVGECLGIELFNSAIIHPFIDQYLAFLFSHSMIRYEYTEFLVEQERGLIPTFIAPLSEQGLKLRDYANKAILENGIDNKGISVTSERRIQMVNTFGDSIRFSIVQSLASELYKKYINEDSE